MKKGQVKPSIMIAAVVVALVIGILVGYFSALSAAPQAPSPDGVVTITKTQTVERERRVTVTSTETVTATVSVTRTVTAAPKFPKIRIASLAAGTSGVIFAVMEDLKLLEKYGIKDYTITPMSVVDDGPAFFFGKIDVFAASTLEAADFTNRGVPTTIFAPGAVFHPAIIVRKDSPYKTWEDLFGKKLGIPGFGTGTWKGFEILSRIKFGSDFNPREAYKIVVGRPPALIGFIERGEVDAIMIWEAFISRLLATGKYRILESYFNDIWKEATGQDLLIAAPAVRSDWIDKYPDLVRALALAIRDSIDWIIKNPEQTVAKYGEKFFGVKTEAERKLAAESITKAPWYVTKWDVKLFKAQLEFISKAVELGFLDEEPRGRLFIDLYG